MDFLKRLFGGKPANATPAPAPVVSNSGAAAPQHPVAPTAQNTIVGGKRRRQTRRNRKVSRKHGRK
jgi:hypothetical protein